jgi:hypothetical protein
MRASKRRIASRAKLKGQELEDDQEGRGGRQDGG